MFKISDAPFPPFFSCDWDMLPVTCLVRGGLCGHSLQYPVLSLVAVEFAQGKCCRLIGELFLGERPWLFPCFSVSVSFPFISHLTTQLACICHPVSLPVLQFWAASPPSRWAGHKARPRWTFWGWWLRYLTRGRGVWLCLQNAAVFNSHWIPASESQLEEGVVGSPPASHLQES